MTTTAVAAAAALLDNMSSPAASAASAAAAVADDNVVVVEERPKPPPPSPPPSHKNVKSREEVISSASQWHVLGRRVPRSEIVFACQMILVYIVVCASIINLSMELGDSNLWTALLSSCLGYILPNPKLSSNKNLST